MIDIQAVLGLAPFDPVSATGALNTHRQTTIFETKRAHGIKVSHVDFATTTAPSLKGLYLCVLDNVLSHDECQRLVSAAEAYSDNYWTDVVESSDDGKLTTRACKRIMWDSPECMSALWARIREHVPELRLRQDSTSEWHAKRLNERMRFLKYDAGDYFQAHPDCYYETPNGNERSYITVYVYLNDAEVACCGHTFDEGATTFYSQDLSEAYTVVPKAGRVMLFEQEELLHAGENVASGCKYALRTDLMYEHRRNVE